MSVLQCSVSTFHWVIAKSERAEYGIGVDHRSWMVVGASVGERITGDIIYLHVSFYSILHCYEFSSVTTSRYIFHIIAGTADTSERGSCIPQRYIVPTVISMGSRLPILGVC